MNIEGKSCKYRSDSDILA